MRRKLGEEKNWNCKEEILLILEIEEESFCGTGNCIEKLFRKNVA
jgi:hypothetical protein